MDLHHHIANNHLRPITTSHPPPTKPLVEETISNITSASGENSTISFASPAPNKKKRSLPGKPDPEAQVIALSPRSLLATNRFVCEICGKGFQRDQNLQLHRRGHNLPWKLKQRSSKEVRKKVYVCPETTCVHHDPSRALGDLTGIKKHFCRKHGEKRWKCDKCSKKYAVQSDWKAHTKTCGTREYRCDCGTLFSWRDSFITHRAFCDALAEESARVNTTASSLIPAGNPMLLLPSDAAAAAITSSGELQSATWQQQQPPSSLSLTPLIETTALINTQDLPLKVEQHQQQLPTFTNNMDFQPPSFPPNINSSHHMSATALFQRAAQIGATISRAPLTQLVGLSGPSQPPQFPLINDMVTGGFHGPFDEAIGAMVMNRDGLTRDFLGLRHITQRDILTFAELSSCMSNTYQDEQRFKEPCNGL